jgi:hypothetical protein
MNIAVKAWNRCRRRAAVSAPVRHELPDSKARRVAWVGADPDSGSNECPAVAVLPETGDFLFRGKTVTDPAVITTLNQHIGKADDESDIWLPARMAPLIREALDGFDLVRHGPGQHTVAELLASACASVIRFTLGDRDSEGTRDAGGRAGDSDGCSWGGDFDTVHSAAARGVTVRGLEILTSPPPSDPEQNSPGSAWSSKAGGDIRWLPRASVADLLLPGADCWVFDYRVVRWDFPDSDSSGPRCCAFSSDPRVIRDIAAAFEIAWSRATPARR